MSIFTNFIHLFIVIQFHSTTCQELPQSSNDQSDFTTDINLPSTTDESSNISTQKDISTETPKLENSEDEVHVNMVSTDSSENLLHNETFSDSTSENTASPNEILQKIGILSKKILELVEPLAIQTDKYSVESKFIPQSPSNNDKFFLSFMFDNRQNSKNPLGRKMTVNNNFHGNHLFPSQVFVESGSKAKQISGPNIQMTSPNMNKQMPNKVPEKGQGHMDVYKLYGEQYENKVPMPYFNGKPGPIRQI